MSDRLDYDAIAPTYDERYRLNEYDALERYLARHASGRVLEVGCGSGRWLELLATAGASVAGLDRSYEMLARARERLPGVELVEGSAEALPWEDGTFDRVVAVNALHHFDDAPGFIGEARRVLRAGGELVVIGLDPSRGLDRWWIYDWFAGALDRDLARYPAASRIRELMAGSGLASPSTTVAQHIELSLAALDVLDGPRVAKRSTSQLAMLDDETYEDGIRRIRAAAQRDPALRLDADLRLWATTASR